MVSLAGDMQALAGRYIPQSYQLGKQKAEARYGWPSAWTDQDQANVTLLLESNATALQVSFMDAEQDIATGTPRESILKRLLGRLSAWAWVLSPALAFGTAAYVHDKRNEIAIEEKTTPDKIGIIWYSARDARVCPKCIELSGRWFPAQEGYRLAASVHPGCRCSAYFDVGTPDEAVQGPYVPERVQALFQDLPRGSWQGRAGPPV